jgi:hypothetical protein
MTNRYKYWSVIQAMSSNLQKFSFAATFSILSMIVVSSIFILTNQYYYNFNNFNNSKLKMGNNDKVDEMLSSFVGSRNLYKNKIVFASSDTTSSLSNGNTSATLSLLSNSSIKTPTRSNSLEYTARVLCGTIVGEDGPLRPGRYNSDINIFNRQDFPVSFLWKAVLSSDLIDGKQNQGEKNSNFILLTLHPGNSISISCNDIRQYLPAYSNGNTNNTDFFEGVLTISVELEPSIQGALSSSLVGKDHSQQVVPSLSNQGSEPNANILSVDAIYTVNALEVASREIVLQLIEYSITNQDQSGKIPDDMISKILSVTVPIRPNETINPDKQVRDVLMREYSLSTVESQNLNITIRNLSLGVGALDDNHAISLQRINAYQPPL